MRKCFFLAMAVLMFASLAGTAIAATWYYWGTPGFTTNPAWMYDSRRIKFNAIEWDSAGNLYVTAVNGNNNGTSGGLSIFKTNGTRVDVDLNALGFQGGVTKLVRGGDGAIYGLQNWLEINWPYNSGVPNRIIKIDANGGVSQIWSPGAASDANRIGGMTVGMDGNIYWTANGADGYWKYHFLWRYDPVTQAVEEYPNSGTNNGWSETHRMVDLEATAAKSSGGQWFSVIKMGNQTWRQDPMSWTDNRVVGNTSDPGWGRDWSTITVYDPVRNKLWTGARGASNRLILTRWNDISADTGIAASADVWHAVNSDADMGTTWWTSGLTVDADGNAWMGFGAGNNTATLGGYREHVIRRDLYLGMYDEGVPQVGSDIAALGYASGAVFALVVDRTTGAYNLYGTVPVPEPGSLLALASGLVGLAGLAIRRRR